MGCQLGTGLCTRITVEGFCMSLKMEKIRRVNGDCSSGRERRYSAVSAARGGCALCCQVLFYQVDLSESVTECIKSFAME